MTKPAITVPPIDRKHWEQRLAALAERHKVPGASLGVLRLASDWQHSDRQPDEEKYLHFGVRATPKA